MKENASLHLWYAHTRDLSFAELWETHSALLPQQEKEKILSYLFDKDRILSLVSRVMLRRMLSFVFPANTAESWHFSTTHFGKPFIEANGEEARLQFNLSHTEGLVACAVAVDKPLGIDVEITKKSSVLDIAPTVFTPNELAGLRAFADQQDLIRHFYRLWTLKEAYIKCLGGGLSIPLQDFEFELEKEKVNFKIIRQNGEHPSLSFCSTRFGAEHMLSLAIQTEGRFDIKARDFSDLHRALPTEISFDLPFPFRDL